MSTPQNPPAKNTRSKTGSSSQQGATQATQAASNQEVGLPTVQNPFPQVQTQTQVCMTTPSLVINPYTGNIDPGTTDGRGWIG